MISTSRRVDRNGVLPPPSFRISPFFSRASFAGFVFFCVFRSFFCRWNDVVHNRYCLAKRRSTYTRWDNWKLSSKREKKSVITMTTQEKRETISNPLLNSERAFRFSFGTHFGSCAVNKKKNNENLQLPSDILFHPHHNCTNVYAYSITSPPNFLLSFPRGGKFNPNGKRMEKKKTNEFQTCIRRHSSRLCY